MNHVNKKEVGWKQKLVHGLVIFFAFVPFFAFRELGRVLGEGKIRDMFFHGISVTESDLPGCRKD